VAVLPTVRVRVLVLVAGSGLNDAVTPLGKLEADKVTLLLNPFDGVIVIVLVPCVPRAMVRLRGEADKLKFGAAVTVRLTDVVCVRLPDVPVTVTLNVPVLAVLPAVNVNVLVPVAGSGLNDAVTPPGKPEADKVTLLLNPFDGVIVIVVAAWLPCPTVTLPGDADKLKFGAAEVLTVRLTEVVCIRLPDVPVTVTLNVPVLAVLPAVNVNVLVPVAGFGLNDAVTPLG
jgi:hypothetical protein